MSLKEPITKKPWTVPDQAASEQLSPAGSYLGHEKRPESSPTDALLWVVIAVIAVGSLTTMTLWGWTIEWRSFELPVGVSVIFLVLGWASTGRSSALARTGYAVACILLMSHGAVTLSYVVGSWGGPFRDNILRGADAQLGFSWMVWNRWLVSHPTLNAFLSWIYPQVILATIAVTLVVAMERDARPFLRAIAVAFGFTLAGMLLVPAAGNDLADPSVSVRIALEAGTFRHYDIARAAGLVTMPSFHAVLAVLCALACWPLRWLRWPAMVYNAVMLVATVRAGGHYLVDVLAGIAVAIGSAWLVRMPAVRREALSDSTLTTVAISGTAV
jgi:membrane-associated phospholipid phosphatase